MPARGCTQTTIPAPMAADIPRTDNPQLLQPEGNSSIARTIIATPREAFAVLITIRHIENVNRFGDKAAATELRRPSTIHIVNTCFLPLRSAMTETAIASNVPIRINAPRTP